MFCSNCGNQLPEGVNFCGKCGFSVNNFRPQNSNINNRGAVSSNNNFYNNDLNKPFKIIFVVMVIISFIISQSKLIDFVYVKFTLKEFVAYIKMGSTMSGIVDMPYARESSTQLLTLSLGLMGIGTMLLIVAAIVVFFKTNTAHFMIVIGAAANIVSIFIFIAGCTSQQFEMELGDILSMLSNFIWIYIILNIAMIILSAKCFCSNGLEDTYYNKSYNFLNKTTENIKRNVGDWNCPECGKLNSSSTQICSCGTQKRRIR